ncbi:MAG TPA: Zn-dependent hydrolase [Candidatus Limnocylindrales bacterium]|nr:Zn-dependent hydrolase [Candidatus Limnocylindrales bacterium]
MTDAARLEKRIADLAKIGGSGTSVSRLGLTSLEQEARDLVAQWCAPHAESVRRDAAGNLYVRFAGERQNDPVVLVGSHADSVPEGGRFDGALGVCCAVEAVVSLKEQGLRFRRPVEVVAWADEEGARFGIGLFGSAAAFGRLPPGAADLRDKAGVSIADALRALGESGDPTAAARDPKGIRAYLELHIEQGPRLERAGVPLGVVSDIVGIYHGRMRIRGRADHAGATVMGARQDALAAAAQIIVAVERIAASVPDAVGTVGEITVRPGAKNVVPGECVFSLDIRAPKMESLQRVVNDVSEEARRVTRERGLTFELELLHGVPVTPLDPALRQTLVDAVRMLNIDPPLLVSGAGHDAQNPSLAGVPTGMIFVRSTGGSHTPTELAATADAVLGTRALETAISDLLAI